MPSLGALITARRKALSLTYDALSERSGDALSKQRWQQLGTDTRVNEFPEPRTLELIADTIGVGVDRVILATAVTLGVDIPSQRSTFATMLPPNADELTEEQRDAVIAVIRAMRPPASTEVEDPAAGTGGFIRAVQSAVQSIDSIRQASLLEHYAEMYRRALPYAHNAVLQRQAVEALGAIEEC